jgi:hypothetical protein
MGFANGLTHPARSPSICFRGQAGQRRKFQAILNSFATSADQVTKDKTREAYMRAKAAMMESFSIWHWIIFVMVIAMGVSPILGIIRGVRNGGVVHAVASVFVPVYGLIYFFAARQPRK